MGAVSCAKPCENFFPLELVVTWSLIDFACTLPPPTPPTQAYCPSPMTPDMHADLKLFCTVLFIHQFKTVFQWKLIASLCFFYFHLFSPLKIWWSIKSTLLAVGEQIKYIPRGNKIKHPPTISVNRSAPGSWTWTCGAAHTDRVADFACTPNLPPSPWN